ncbi:MAG: HEXXH motif-containing putative peptide modification protein [Acidobacteria bacterium]|nr:HEXXH motif-containing putative peptide modification protein [Acidobacteriota bacterium]MDA1237212.1 HEXXH motif-containing putative peptide modification protein [Acidobacteriota bacterium]
MTLERFLRWDDDVAQSAYLAEYQRRAEQRLSSGLAIVQRHSDDLGGLLVSLLSTLPEAQVLRVAAAPELEFQVRFCRTADGSIEDLAGFLVSAFQQALAQAEDGADHVEWPQIDFDGPFNRGDAANRFSKYSALGAPGRGSLPAQIGDAMELLESAAPHGAHLTRALTTVVVPIAVQEIDGRCGYFSSSWYPGRTVLVNPDAGRMSLEGLAAALLHEAIHSLIDVSELGGRLVAGGVEGSARVESPWTGSQISLQSLLDAYFVWYGLLWLWRGAREQGVVHPSKADLLILQCERGFQARFSDVVGNELSSVHEATRAAIESLRNAVHHAVAVA